MYSDKPNGPPKIKRETPPGFKEEGPKTEENKEDISKQSESQSNPPTEEENKELLSEENEEVVDSPYTIPSDPPSNENQNAGFGPIGPNVGQTPPPPPGTHNPPPVPEEEDVTIEIDPEMTYIFMFGNSKSGKSAIISNLLYYLHMGRVGDGIENLNDNRISHERRGNILKDALLINIPEGKFPKGTTTLLSERRLIPKLMKSNFTPSDHRKPEFKFCLIDVSGEELELVYQRAEDNYTRLPQGIEVFLQAPPQNLIFISVFPSFSENLSFERLGGIHQYFIDLLDHRGLKSIPFLLLLSKWDLEEDNFETAQEFLKAKAPIIWSRINEPGRNCNVSTFSVGDVSEDNESFQFDPSDAKKLFRWLYQTQTGIDLDSQPSKTIWAKFIDTITGRE